MDSKNILTHLIRAGRDALHLEKTLTQLGYKETPYYNLYGEIAEAIYALVGEKTESFDQSETCAVMKDIYTPDELCAERLAYIIDSDSVFCLNLPDSVKIILEEIAEMRGVSFNSMVRIALCEWAIQHVYHTETNK